MTLSTHTKPISYLKANAAQVATELRENGEAYVITQNGEPTMVVQSVREYEQTQETLALLKMLNQSEQDIQQGNTISVEDALKNIQARHGL